MRRDAPSRQLSFDLSGEAVPAPPVVIRSGPDWLQDPGLQDVLQEMGLQDVQVQFVGFRRSYAGKAYGYASLVRIVSEGVHPLRWLVTFLHELAHVLDWRERKRDLEAQLGRPLRRGDGRTLWGLDRAHGKRWQTQFSRLAEVAIAHGLFPGNEGPVREHAGSGATTSDHVPLDLAADPRVQAEELRALDEHQRARFAQAQAHLRSFRETLQPGQLVHFDAGKYTGILTGTLVRINRQTCTVAVGRVQWRVPPHLLQPGPAPADTPPPPVRPHPRDRFRVGQTVSFRHEGQRHEGRITRVNRKTCTVQTPAGPWRVTFGLLTPKDA